MADLKKVRIQLLDENDNPIEEVDVLTSAGAVMVLKNGTEVDLQSYLESLVLQKGDDGITYDWLNGVSTPASTLGKIGDWYINTATCDLYKKTATSTWTLQCNIKGAAGAQGATGATGATGAKGDTGATGAQGETGAAGTLTFPVTAATSTAPTGARVGDLILNAGTATLTIAGVSTAVGGLVKITTLSPLAGTASGNVRGATGATGATGAKGDKGDPGDVIKMGATQATATEVKIFFKVVG